MAKARGFTVHFGKNIEPPELEIVPAALGTLIDKTKKD